MFGAAGVRKSPRRGEDDPMAASAMVTSAGLARAA